MGDVVIFDEGGPNDPHSLPLATKKRNHIRNVVRKQSHPTRMQATRARVLEAHSTAVMRSLSSVYNCFGMVFGCRRTVIIDGAEVEKVLSDDGYRLLGTLEKVRPGDVVIYRKVARGEIEHAAVVQSIIDSPLGNPIVTVISQWGSDGEYLHRVDDVPAIFGTLREFYTDRTP